MGDSILYKLTSGKPIKFLDFMKNFMGLLVPDAYYRSCLKNKLSKAKSRKDYDYILKRVDYYNKYSGSWTVSPKDYYKRERSWIFYTGAIGDYKRKMFHTAYYFDQHDVTRWFASSLRWNFCPGDVYFTPEVPTIVKSRLLSSDNHNSVILKLDKLRHFLFIRDEKPFTEKMDKAIFRGKIRQSRVRTRFLEMFFDNPMFDCGVVGRNEGCPQKWMSPKKTIREHLDYKFVMALEGNDVASNLKWVMSSNSIAVMTKPTCETWFMEGTLKPDFHYIEVKEDFSDLEEKLKYYTEHTDEAQKIIDNAHEYVSQFMDEEREDIISLMVLQKYFHTSGQL